MAQLATLSELQHDGQKLLRIILVGQSQFRTLLNQPEVARIRQQLYGERVLEPLTLTETERYVQHRLQVAGAGEATLFDPEAVAMVHEASGGIPRLINHICDAALLAAFGASEPRVGSTMVAEVSAKRDTSRRTVPAKDLGLASSDRVAAGLTTGKPSPDRAELVSGESVSPSRQVESTPPITAFNKSGEGSGPAGPLAAKEMSLTELADAPQPGSLFNPAEATPTSEEPLLNRLERALARAERINTTTEASLSQQAAVEKHLISLTAGAERIIGSLTASALRASEFFEDVRGRVDHVFAEAEARLSMISEQLSHTSEVSREAEEQVNRVEEACTRAEHTQSRLASFAEHLADKGDEVQEWISALMTGLEASESAQNRLDSLLKQESSLLADADKRIDLLRTALSESRTAARQFQEQFTETALAPYREKFRAQLNTFRRTHEEAVQTAIERHRRRLQTMIDDAQTRARTLEETIAARQQKTDATFTSYQESAAQTLDSIESRVRRQREQIKTLQQRQEAARTSVSASAR